MKNEHKSRPGAVKALEALRKVLTEIGWDSEPDEKNASFYVNFGPPHVPVSDAMATITVETERFLFYVNFGPLAPPERRDEVARFITLANWGLSVGNFEMDYEDGFVRFKSSVGFNNTDLPEALIRNAILAAMNAIEIYAEPLIDVLGRGKSAQEAFTEAKANQA
ncbi:MAG TPA: YbjN domain-containing protein [Candidatus Polarisedimenticolia bacterium]|nr:YbjN domain-containing protein [Candidatus Polarisedimenticolia bacterium]